MEGNNEMKTDLFIPDPEAENQLKDFVENVGDDFTHAKIYDEQYAVLGRTPEHDHLVAEEEKDNAVMIAGFERKGKKFYLFRVYNDRTDLSIFE